MPFSVCMECPCNEDYACQVSSLFILNSLYSSCLKVLILGHKNASPVSSPSLGYLPSCIGPHIIIIINNPRSCIGYFAYPTWDTTLLLTAYRKCTSVMYFHTKFMFFSMRISHKASSQTIHFYINSLNNGI